MDQKLIAVRGATEADAAVIAAIYNDYVRNSVATFEESEITADMAAGRIRQVLDEGLVWLVAEENSRVVGYAYAARWNVRAAYRYTAEVTVYLTRQAVSKGIGTRLYVDLFAHLERAGIRSAIAGITLPNPASVAIHEKFGMRKVGHFDKVGYKFGRWLDVGYWQGELLSSA